MADGLIGQTLGGTYRITRSIGRGGMGVVYEAVNVRIERRFAVKVLRVSRSDDQDNFDRFEREARIGSRLGHENIVQVIDFNHTEDGSPFLVMEMLEGTDLSEVLRKGRRLPLARAGNIFRQVGQALAAAHAEKVVHRDLKPENIFLCKRPAGGELAKVLDFGISKVMDSSTMLTRGSAVMGTPNYMSPEQARGKIELIDHRTDILAMGTILHQMLTGQLPHRAPDALSVLYQVVDNDLPPLERFRPGLPPGLQEVVSRATHKDRELRYDSVEQMVASLATAMGDRWRDALMQEVGDPLLGYSLDPSAANPELAEADTLDEPSPTASTQLSDDGLQPPDAPADADVNGIDSSEATVLAKDRVGKPETLKPAEKEEEGEGEEKEEGEEARPSGILDSEVFPPPSGGLRRLVLPGGMAALILTAGALFYASAVEEDKAPAAAMNEARPAAAPTRPSAAVSSLPDGALAAAAPDLMRAPIPPKPDPAQASTPATSRFLEVLTAPEGAEILLDGKSMGKAPLRGDFLDEGEHVVKVRKKGYAGAKQRVAAGKEPARLSLRLRPLPATIRVSSLHAGKLIKATVYLDGKKVDQTPAALKGITPGRHELKLVREGFKPRVREVDLRPGQLLSLALGLEKE